MKREYSLKIDIPEGVACELNGNSIKCTKQDLVLEKKLTIPEHEIKVEGNQIILNCKKANKKNINYIKTNFFHIKNILRGLDEEFSYDLEVCYVHFPMTLKLEGKKLLISNFLGEKVSRIAKILDDVQVKLDGSKIIVSSRDIEKAGQTAANIEKATKVPKKDRRIFQDGIFITKKPRAN